MSEKRHIFTFRLLPSLLKFEEPAKGKWYFSVIKFEYAGWVGKCPKPA
jgi:hypothetical protein